MTPENPNSRAAVDTLVWLAERAFRKDPHQSLLANLRRLRDEDWTALPAGGGRTIADILEHVGWAKWMYDDYAFGSASLRGDEPPMVPTGDSRARPNAELLAWLTEGHDRWLSSVRALSSDAELERERGTNWGEYMPTRTIIQIMIAHDIYHAGEINHLRALLQGDDTWRYC